MLAAGSTVRQPTAAGASTQAFPRVTIGPGLVDTSVREIVRTANDVVYVFLADDTAERTDSGPGVIRAWKANQAGLPTGFAEVDGAGRPSSTGATHVLGAPDVRLDRNGVAHLLYANEADATLVYQTFSTVTDRWGPAQVVATGVTVPSDQVIKRSETAYALALDSNDEPQIVYMAGGSVFYRGEAAGVWSSVTAIATGSKPIHPSAAIDASGAFHVAWLDDGVSPTIDYALRSADGTWSSDEVVASGDVLSNANHDQGPSLVVNSSNTPYVLYDSANPASAARVKYRTSSGWVLDGPPYDLYNHAPALYSQNNDIYLFVGHDSDINYGYAYHMSGSDWSAYMKLTSDPADGSASVRWDPARDNDPGLIDTTFYDENSTGTGFIPLAYYMAITPAGSPSDTTPPTVTLTSPTAGATVSGTTTLSATASDDVGVTSVQFKVDGADVGSAVTTAPYSASWDTTTATAGVHVLTAVARDAAGNTTTSAAVIVTVANSPPPPGATVLGDQKIEATHDSNAAGQAEAFRAVASASGAVTSLALFVDASSTATSVRAGLYSDAAGHPGILLTSGTKDSPVAGTWNQIDLQPTDVVGGQVYWIAVLAPAGAGTLQFRDRGPGGESTETSAETTLGSLSSTWHTGTGYGDGPISAYVTAATATDTTPPTVAITSPAEGAVLCGIVTTTANASDNVGVASLQFQLDGQTIGPMLPTAPYALTWDASTATSGDHVLTAVAVDGAGNRTVSPAIDVHIGCPTPVAPASLFSSTLIPASTGLSVQDGRSGPGPWSYELGVKFAVTAPVPLTALRFYKDAAETGTHVGRVWTSTGEQLAQVTFAGESASGWQQQSLPIPLGLEPGVTYIASVGVNDAFVLTYGGLANQIASGPLQSIADGANGIFGSAAGSFPTQTYTSSNYFVDVVVG
jgi:uncharacterized protein DUF4082/Big-like domain-containing protein